MSGASRNRISASRSSTEKEAKALSTELASLLAKRDPWHQDVVFARENLRRHCLSIIFKTVDEASPGSDAKAIAAQSRKRLQGLNVLFLSTSHSIIHHFRQRLSMMDKLMAQNSAKSERSTNGSGKRGERGTPNPAQRRRLLHSFRDFLAKEETFWRDLLIRIVGVFDVEEARSALRLLQIGIGDWEADPHFAGNKEIHDQAILLCHKTLICFGDLARYRELYAENKAQNRPKPRGGKLAPKAADASKEKTWARAYEAYHHARLLVPDDGNPSNQLAVLAGYQHDDLSTIYHYYRALCVRKAFSTAKQNLGPTFAKILSNWEADEKRKADRKKLQAGSGKYADADDASPRDTEQDASDLVEDFKRSFVVLHAILFQGTHMHMLPEQFTKVTRLFSACMAKRALPSDIVVKVIVTAISSWWYARMYRRSAEKDESTPASSVQPATLESSALMHALAITSELMGLAVRETQEVQLHEALQEPATASKAEQPLLLAQSITAVLRRALPALRIASIWLLSNTDYLARYDSTAGTFAASDSSVPPEVCAAVRGFWTSYANFTNALTRAFPARLLPMSKGHVLLEEDIDMLGFAPLKRRMKEASIGKAAQEVAGVTANAAATSSAMHPNEEQILRICDLLGDAGLLAQSEACPVILESGIFAIRKKRLNPASQPWNPAKAAIAALDRVVSPASDEDEDEDGLDDFAFSDGLPEDEADEDAATEEDVLDLAMRVATGARGAPGEGEMEDEATDDDEEIVYTSRIAPTSRPILPTSTPSPPVQHAAAPAPPGLPVVPNSGVNRTASDLLLQVLQGNSLDLRAPASAAPGSSPILQSANAPLLAGGISSNALSGRSIWSGSSMQGPNFGSPVGQNRTWTGENGGSNTSISTETLFNSMPNENQQALGGRPSPSMSPFGSIGQKAAQPQLNQQQARQHPFGYQNRQPYDRNYG